MLKTFRLTEDHLKLLRRVYIGWDGNEYGAPAIDCKRPYGNSSVEEDICTLLGWWKVGHDGESPCWSDKQRERAAEIHRELQTALQILCQFAAITIRPGLYQQANEYDYRSWERVE